MGGGAGCRGRLLPPKGGSGGFYHAFSDGRVFAEELGWSCEKGSGRGTDVKG